MTHDEIIEMARQVYGTTATEQEIRFAKLVAEKALADHAMQKVQRLGQEIEQKPVAHCKVRPLRGDESFPKVEIDWVNQPVPGPLYTSPPQRTWVELSDEQVNEYNYLGPDMPWVVREVAAILKERNQ